MGVKVAAKAVVYDSGVWELVVVATWDKWDGVNFAFIIREEVKDANNCEEFKWFSLMPWNL